MLTKLPQEFRRFIRNCHTLKRILNDTHRSLNEIEATNLFPEEDIRGSLFSGDLVESLRNVLDCRPEILVFGQSCHTKASFVNSLLGQILLPLHGSSWRWVKILHGSTKRIRLTLSGEFEIVEELKANEGSWIVVPEQDLKRPEHEILMDHSPSLEIEVNHPILKENVTITISPDCPPENLSEILKGFEQTCPVIIYAVANYSFTEENVLEIRKLKEIYSDIPILFVSMDVNGYYDSTADLTESEQHLLEQISHTSPNNSNLSAQPQEIRHQLERLGYISSPESENSDSALQKSCCTDCIINNVLINETEIENELVSFVQGCLKSHLLKMSAILSEVHNKCLRKFILSAFDMAREIQITPRRITYAQCMEAELYKTLMKIASEKQEEITKIIQITLQNMRSNVDSIIEDYGDSCGKEYKNTRHQQTVKMATTEIQQLVLKKLSNSVANQLVKSVACLQESYTGTLQRCLQNLEKHCCDHDSNTLASDAVKQILSAAYNIDLKSSTSFSLVHTFLERLRKLLHAFQLPWSISLQPQLDRSWRYQVALEIIDSLSSSKLARAISVQFQEHVKSSHEAFQSAIRSLENHLSGKLEQTEEQRIAIRKYHAPKFARLALESTSMCDVIRWGMPQQTREIGRGQYGVVFSCEPWGGINPCAVKSVVPPDERHWNDLAMEFYYTRTIPEHKRIVRLRGSVLDQSYGGGCSPAVLLIMERMTRDLYCGLRTGLSWQKRLQIAIDVAEGIRYLHSQGLVHRDIKLKNVLLDNEDRAKLTDFGFCIPEAMMSGSIVGTPVHMAPELLSGHYDSSVDVYAFGILFWYICAGHVRLPYVFEQFRNKEELWLSVRKGIRPECLPDFDEACWNLMEQCWAAEPSSRPLLGYVQPQLEAIMERAVGNTEHTDS